MYNIPLLRYILFQSFYEVRGQTYDTTSSMSSAVNGVHGRFKAIYNKAIYLSCNAHAHFKSLYKF